jgi:hypothetical protein
MTADEQNLLAHLKHHKVKRWLLEGARREDARTIKEAVARTSSERLIQAIARAIKEDRP